jgi:DNA-binding NarL/FixJ family response regulator
MDHTGSARGKSSAALVRIQHIRIAADYRVLLAAEGAGAIRKARQKHIHIDLVLLDVRVPGVSGAELADEILSIRPDVRVLWMSGFVDEP